MRRSNWTPSIVPSGDDYNVYLVMDDLGRLGRVWRESDYEDTSFETVVADLLSGQYKKPIGIFCFNAAEGWSRDVSEVRPPTHRALPAFSLRRCGWRDCRPCG
jgi:hypothetical protein